MTRTPVSRPKVKGQLVADVYSQHAGIGTTWRINTKILSACRGRKHIVAAARLQLMFSLLVYAVVFSALQFVDVRLTRNKL